MKTLIAYYSKTGNTKRVAAELAERLGADIEEIIDRKNRSGIWNWFLSGRDGMKKRWTEIGEMTNDPADYEIIILGSPVWGWNMVPAIRTYLERNKDRIKSYALFVTSGNTDVAKIAPQFKKMLGQEPVAMVGFKGKELKNKNIYDQKMVSFVEKLRN